MRAFFVSLCLCVFVFPAIRHGNSEIQYLGRESFPHFLRGYMLNLERRRQFIDLMTESDWDVLLLYGHSWRKDFFRSLINFNFFGPHAVAVLTRSNEISVVLSHPWDCELLAAQLD